MPQRAYMKALSLFLWSICKERNAIAENYFK